MHADEMHAYEIYAYEMHVHKMRAHRSDFSNNDLCAKYPPRIRSPDPFRSKRRVVTFFHTQAGSRLMASSRISRYFSILEKITTFWSGQVSFTSLPCAQDTGSENP